MLLRSLRSVCRRRMRLLPMLSARMIPNPTVPQLPPSQRCLATIDNLNKEPSLESSSDTKENASKPGAIKYWCAMGEFDLPNESLSLETTSMEELIETVAGVYGFEPGDFQKKKHSIEVYYYGDWLPVKSIEDLKKYQHDDHGARIRVPKLYEAAEHKNEGAAEDFSLPYEKVNYVIEDLIETLHKQGWKPSSFIDYTVDNVVDTLTMKRQASDSEETTTICTRKLILRCANVDDDLREMLVRRIGALDHLAEVLHYSFSWDLHPKVGLKKVEESKTQYGCDYFPDLP